MRSAPLLLALLALAACDSEPAAFSNLGFDDRVLPATVVAGEPFRVVVTGESEPPPAALRFAVYRGVPTDVPAPADEVLVSVDLPVSGGPRVTAEATVTLPADAVSEAGVVYLMLEVYDAGGRFRAANGTEWPVAPAR